MSAAEITFAQRDAAAEFRKAQQKREKALQYMENPDPDGVNPDAASLAVLGFLIADSVYEEKKGDAIRAFAPAMP